MNLDQFVKDAGHLSLKPDTIESLRADLSASRAECERLRANSDRYEWLREHAYKLIGADRGMGPEFPYGDDLDAEIDQSRQALEPK